MKNSSRVLARIAATVLAVALLSPAAATNTLQTYADALITLFDGSGNVARQTDNIAPDGSVSVSSSSTSGVVYDGSASAFVNASNYGELRISGTAAMTGGSAQATGTSSINIRDSINLSDSALTGQAGILTINLFLEGSTEANNNASSTVRAQWEAVVRQINGGVQTNHFVHIVREVDSGATGSYQCLTDGAFTAQCYGLFAFDMPFTFGTDFDLAINFFADATTRTHTAGHVGSSAYDLANSLYWGGISNVRSGGVAVTNYGFTSESGFDWRESYIPANGNGVPEPGTLALLGLGLAGLGFSRRKQ